MKFICEKDELLKSIDIVSKAINTPLKITKIKAIVLEEIILNPLKSVLFNVIIPYINAIIPNK